MSLNAGNILKINITISPKKEILEYIRKYLLEARNPKSEIRNKTEKPLVIVTPNPEQIVLARTNESFRNILNGADVALPDGVGIVWASQFLKQVTVNSKQLTVRERIPGVEFMEDLVGLAAREGVRIGLIGGREGVAVKALECLRAQYPKLIGWAEDGPEIHLNQFDQLNQFFLEISKKIQETDTRIVFVGLGAPKQEYFIEALSRELSLRGQPKQSRRNRHAQGARDDKRVLLMSVGGSFDIIAGRVQRAPLFARLMGFEWLWRLLREPWRFRRQLALLKFIYLVLQEKMFR